MIISSIWAKEFFTAFSFGFPQNLSIIYVCCVRINVTETKQPLCNWKQIKLNIFFFCQLFTSSCETQSQLAQGILTKVSKLLTTISWFLSEDCFVLWILMSRSIKIFVFVLWKMMSWSIRFLVYKFHHLLSVFSSFVWHLLSSRNFFKLSFKGLNNLPLWSFHVHWGILYWKLMLVFWIQVTLFFLLYIYCLSIWFLNFF